MSVIEIILIIILFLISIGAFAISFFNFKEKGFLFNNAYMYASKDERNNMDKNPYYRQSAIVFSLIGIVFLINAIQIFFHSKWLLYIVLAVVFAAIIYVVVSSILIEQKKK